MNPFTLPDSESVASHRTSVTSLVAANAVPLLCVLAFGWSAFNVAFIYWTENVVVGVLNVLKIIFCAPDPQQVELSLFDRVAKRMGATDEDREQLEKAKREVTEQLGQGALANHATKLFLVPFFCVHYGLFCLVHGAIMCVLLGGNGQFAGGGPPGDPFDAMRGALRDPWLMLCIVGLAASHVVSFVTNYLWGGEYRRTIPILLMFQPYGRIVVLHIAILVGGFAAVLLGSPVWLLVPLVIGKTLMDVNLHLWQHQDREEHAGQETVMTTALDEDVFGENDRRSH